MHAHTVRRIAGHSFLPAFLGDQSTVVDLGGNEGAFARQIVHDFGCRCIVVEPNPSLVEQLPATGQFQRFHAAIGGADTPTRIQLHANSQMSGMFTASDGRSPSLMVEGMTLRRLMSLASIDRIDLLKVDIEGAEIEMFDAASDQLLSTIGQITIEFHDFNGVTAAADVVRIRRRLAALGFMWVRFTRRYCDDVLLINSRHCPLSRMQFAFLRYVTRNAIGADRMFRRLLGRPQA